MRTIVLTLVLIALSACGSGPTSSPESAAETSDPAPAWAHRRLFGHASPRLLIAAVGGGLVDGRDVVGKKRLMVFFDWATQEDRYNAAITLKILQQAQPELEAAGVEPMFIQTALPGGRPRSLKGDTDLREFCEAHQANAAEGGPLPLPPLYRTPNRMEDDSARWLGIEGGQTYLENFGEPPNIVLLDERGIVRWHSEGSIPGDWGDPDMQQVIVDAVTFAVQWL